MKQKGLTIFVLAMALTPALAYAQMNGSSIKADVPFEFTAGERTIPAGQVVVKAEGATNSALSIANPEARVSTYVVPMPTESLNPSRRTVLVFHKYGDRYFLSQIQRDGSSAGYRLKETKVEKELRAQNQAEEIRLAAK